PEDFVGVFQPDGGFIRAESTVAAFQTLAQRSGAELRTQARVLAVEPHREGVLVKTEHDDVLAECAIVAAGPWLKSLLPQVSGPIRVTRQVLGWFEPVNRAQFAADRFPVFLLQNPDGIFYGFPAEADGVKVAKHHHADETVDPDHYDHIVSA